MQAALKHSPGNAEMEQKARQLRRLAAGCKENRGGNTAAGAQPAPVSAAKEKEDRAPASAVVRCLASWIWPGDPAIRRPASRVHGMQ
jgi:hypothetical protein